ncbi:hypothetical protein NQZ68_033839 [Dissostichus eleginoides]|nr:hypothetical protein NQZ68_033839 [Dissostichus eleginoides]
MLFSKLDQVNKHKPWIETSYHGVITENMDTVLLDPPLVALDKDAPVPYAGSKQKDEIKDVIVSSLFEQGVLQKRVIGDVEKMVAIPAVVQSFHQAPPVDLQVRGDPRAPEWANGDWVRSPKDDSSLSALWTEFLPEEKFRDVAQGYFGSIRSGC